MDKKNKLYVGIAILVVLCLATAGFISYYGLLIKEDEEESKGLVKSYDDRVGLGVNDGLILEINRVRHRGSLDALLSKGNAYKSVPTFFYEGIIDDTQFSSASISGGVASGGAVSGADKTWDTIMQDRRFPHDPTEEQLTSKITITFYEQKTTNHLIRKDTINNIEKDKFGLVYNYKTGRWTGDDFFRDSDGMGHFLGETFEVWFSIYQVDTDYDEIPYWIEKNVLGTDPLDNDKYNDPDSDGIPTTWEWKWGYDPFTWNDHRHLDPDIDGIKNIDEYQMEKWFANPYQQDVYLEVDGMQAASRIDKTHMFHKISQQALIERFASNGVNVYIDDGWNVYVNGGGELVSHDHRDIISQPSGIIFQYYKFNFPDERKGIFRYVLMAHRAGFCIPSEYNNYDTIAVGTCLESMIKVKKAFTERARFIMEAAYVMHEMGHSFGIVSETIAGCDNFTYTNGLQAKKNYGNIWGDYYSVMNYYHITDKTLLDYSHGDDAENDLDDWSNLYLPTFVTQSYHIEEPDYSITYVEGLAEEQLEMIGITGWKYNKELTQKFKDEIRNIIFSERYDNTEFDIALFEKTADVSERLQNAPSFRVYVRPHLAVETVWTFSYEGELNSEGGFDLYSQNDEVELVELEIAKLAENTE